MASEERCVCCGEIIPEGQQVCANCYEENERKLKERSYQWRRGGLCQICRRRTYCKTRCTANKNYAEAGIREYLNRRFGLNRIRSAMQLPEDKTKK